MQSSRMLARALALTLLLATCTSTTSSEAPRDEPSKPDATDPDPVVVEDEPKPERATDAELADCPVDRDADSLCTASGKLAGRFGPVDTIRVATDAEVIYASAEVGTEQKSLTIAVQGETLWIRAVECGSCRRVMGVGFEGQLDQLSAEQLEQVRARFGIAGNELTTAQAWRTYATSPEGRAQLDALVVADAP
jgi:hypothetical protein